MNNTFPVPVKDATLLRLTEESVLDTLKKILAQFWLPPYELKAHIEAMIAPLVGDGSLHVVVSGETKNISLYVLNSTGVLAMTPLSSLNSNMLLREMYGEAFLPRDTVWHIFPPDASLLHRLSLPRVLLINPCVLENFPIPRLCLSIGLLGSYLRKYQKADVHIIDMQIGPSVEDILREAVQLQPALIGMSISYGQKHLALSILKEIYESKKRGNLPSQVVLGNIIPASFPKEFIEMYPDIIVACGEGEVTIVRLVEYLTGTRELADVPGIAYTDASGQIRRTLHTSVPVENIPLPALDTIKDLSRWRGALTLELSRGCQWNVCTFCPREHKSSHWKTFATPQILEQFGYLREACNHFGLTKHIFLADEEFVGGMNDGMETERITDLAQALIKGEFGMKFDAAARVDQVYNPKMDRAWHIQRMKMWHLCYQAGLNRLFMGIESGSNAQLRRYGKGIDAEHTILAIRILSALGIPLRFGFITFDQLMVGLRDLKENSAFLGRTDAFMKKVDVAAYGYEKLFDLLVSDKEFIAAHSVSKPIYAGVSYMLASMEVLINSRYKLMLKNAERRYKKPLVLDENTPDTNMGRYRVEFVDDLIRDISVSCQKWIDRHFGLAYTAKSLYKVAPQHEKEYLTNWMVAYRKISFLLLKGLVYIFDRESGTTNLLDSSMARFLRTHAFAQRIKVLQSEAEKNYVADRVQLIEECMNIFETLVASENTTLEALLRLGKITDTEKGQLSRVLDTWRENMGVWTLINDLNTMRE
jgi:methylmalonyl-CoA mutase cobalamin-binding subunit